MWRLWFTLFFSWLVAAGCDDEEPHPELSSDGGAGDLFEISDPSDSALDPIAEVELFEIETSIVENPRNTLSAIISVTTTAPTSVQVLFESNETAEQHTSLSSLNTHHQITIVGLRGDTTYILRLVVRLADGVEIDSEPLTFTTGELPSDFPEFDVVIHDAARVQPGFTLFGVAPSETTSGGYHYVGVDEQGEVVWYYRDTVAQPDLVRDIKMLSDGTLLMSLFNEYRIITIGGETVASVRSEEAGLLLHHDGVQLPSDNLLLLAHEIVEMTVETLDPLTPVRVDGDRIVEVTLGGLQVWNWSTFDWLDTERFPGQLSRTLNRHRAYEWTHGNAVVFVEDEQAILYSARHQSWVIKLDYPSGEIIWRLGPQGDFTLLPGGEWFYSQHAPEMDSGGTILIYDNGNERPDVEQPYSRAVAYRLDETELTAEQIWEYRTEYYTGFLGDADLLPNGNVLVCAGGVMVSDAVYPDPDEPTIVEVTMDDPAEVVWELTGIGNTYRAIRLTSFWPED